MNKKILSAALVLTIAGSAAFAQSKNNSAPVKTEVTTPVTTQSAPIQKTTTQNSQIKKTPTNQIVTPPEAVVTKFKLMYPSVTEITWVQNKQMNFVGVFKNSGKECRAAYKSDGTFVRELMVIQQNELPSSVSSYLTNNFAGKTPKKVEQVKNEKGVKNYIIKYDDKTVRLDANGKEVKQVEESEKSE